MISNMVPSSSYVTASYLGNKVKGSSNSGISQLLCDVRNTFYNISRPVCRDFNFAIKLIPEIILPFVNYLAKGVALACFFFVSGVSAVINAGHGALTAGVSKAITTGVVFFVGIGVGGSIGVVFGITLFSVFLASLEELGKDSTSFRDGGAVVILNYFGGVIGFVVGSIVGVLFTYHKLKAVLAAH